MAAKKSNVGKSNQVEGAGLAMKERGGSAEACAEFRAQAAAVPAKDVRPMRADASLAAHNVGVALDALQPHAKALSTLPAPFSWKALRLLSRLASAVVYANAQVDRSSPGVIAKKLKRAAELRTILLNGAVSLADAGAVPRARVVKIQKGSGPRDMAQDCVDLAALFRELAAQIKGKTAVGNALVDEAATAGDELLVLLKPKAAKGQSSAVVRAAVAERDRLWTLLWNGYQQQARRAGMWLWLDDVDAFVPPLQSRAVRPAKKPAPAPGG